MAGGTQTAAAPAARRGLARAGQGLGVLCLLPALWLPVRLGASGGGLVLFAAFALGGVWLPGRVLAGLAGADKAGVRRTASLVLGTALLAGAAALGGATGLHGLVWALPALGLAGRALTRRRIPWGPVLRRRGDGPAAGWPWLLAFGALALLWAVGAAPGLAHPAAVGDVTPNQDFLWNLGNVQAFLQGFPPRDLRFAGYPLTYHWLTELLAAGFAMAGVPAYDALAFGVPLAALAAVLACVRELGGVWFSAAGPAGARRRTALLAALLLGAGSGGLWKVLSGRDPFWNMAQRHVLTNINGWATALFLLCAVLACAALLWQGRGPAALGAGLGLAAFLLLCLAKGPVAGVTALALALAAGLRLALGAGQQDGGALAAAAARRGERLCALYAGGCLLVFAGVYAALFSAGAGSSVAFSLTGTLEKSWFGNLLALARALLPGWAFAAALPFFWLALAVCWAPAAAPLAIGGFAAALRRFPRIPGQTLLAAGLAGGGFLAFCLFDHESMSQMYFAFAAGAGMALLAADAAPALFARARQGAGARRAARGALCLAAAALAAAGFATGALNAAAMVREGLAARASFGGPARADGWDLALSAGDEAAAAALAEILPAGGDAVFVTNRIHSGRALEGLSNVYTGLSGRQSWMEGFKYARSNLGVSLEEVLARLEAVRAALRADTAAGVRAALPGNAAVLVYSKTAAARGWDILEGEAPGAGPAQLPVLYENDDVILYDLR